MPTVLADSPEHPALAPFALLRSPAAVRRSADFVAEGRGLVAAVLARADLKPRALLLSPAARAALERAGVGWPAALSVVVAEPAVQRAFGGHRFHQGALALVERPPPRTLADLAPPCAGAGPWLALERVTNPDNVGALLRTAAALGARAALLDRRSADPLYRKALRASLGAALAFPWARVADLPGTLCDLARAGARVLALVPDPRAEDLRAYAARGAPRGPEVLVLGSEGEGLRPGTLAVATHRLALRMQAGVDSLNVNAAAAVALALLDPQARSPAA